MIRILYFGHLGSLLGQTSEETGLPAEVQDIAALLRWLAQRGAAWDKLLRANPALKITVNKQFADHTTPVKDGDEVALVAFAMA